MTLLNIFKNKRKQVIKEQFHNLEAEIWILEDITIKHNICENELLARLKNMKNSLNVIQGLQK